MPEILSPRLARTLFACHGSGGTIGVTPSSTGYLLVVETPDSPIQRIPLGWAQWLEAFAYWELLGQRQKRNRAARRMARKRKRSAV